MSDIEKLRDTFDAACVKGRKRQAEVKRRDRLRDSNKTDNYYDDIFNCELEEMNSKEGAEAFKTIIAKRYEFLSLINKMTKELRA